LRWVKGPRENDLVAKATKSAAVESWDLYKDLAVTDEQRKAARERMLADGERARRDGVFERMESWRGRIKWSISLEELRKDDD
jgi:hypothetical protein